MSQRKALPPRSIEDTARRIDLHLAEFRIMGPALGALLGFQLVSALGPNYVELPADLRVLNFTAVACTAFALVFSLVPTAYHRLAHASDDEQFVTFVRRNTSFALAFLAASLVLSLALQASRSFGSGTAALVVGLTGFTVLAFAWWLVPRRLCEKQDAHAM